MAGGNWRDERFAALVYEIDILECIRFWVFVCLFAKYLFLVFIVYRRSFLLVLIGYYLDRRQTQTQHNTYLLPAHPIVQRQWSTF